MARCPCCHEVTGRASAVSRRSVMTVTVEVREDEDLTQALDRFTQLVQHEYRRPWTKRRFGYFEKPSALRRKARKMRKLQAQTAGHLGLRINLEPQWRRTGPTNAAGR